MFTNTDAVDRMLMVMEVSADLVAVISVMRTVIRQEAFTAEDAA